MYTMTNGGNYAPTILERSVSLAGTRKHKRKFRGGRSVRSVKVYDYGMMTNTRKTVVTRTITRK